MANVNGHQASLICTGCGVRFRCSARRAKMAVRGQASRLCGTCLDLGRKASSVKVLPEHKIWWRAMRDSGMTTVSGEEITQQWIDEIAELIWG